MIAVILHGNGIGNAGDSDAWYGFLRYKLADNVKHLDTLKGFHFKRYFSEYQLVFFDAVALCALVVAIFVRVH